MRLALSEGEMEENRIDVMISPRAAASEKPTIAVDNSNPGFEIFKLTKEGKGKKGEKKKMTVAEARPIIEENETERLMDEHDVLKEAIASVEVRFQIFIGRKSLTKKYKYFSSKDMKTFWRKSHNMKD